MIDWVIDNLLGNWGRPVVDFYVTYALPINIVVVAYGALLVWLHVRLRPYRAAAVAEARGIIAGLGKPPTGHALAEFVGKRFDWKPVLAVGEGRLVAGRWKLWPTRITAESVPRLLPMAELVRDAASPR